MTTTRPNVLFIMTDEERYPPPYEMDALAEFRRTQLPARERLRAQSRELHRHYAGATACTPSRTTLFTGQYSSLHGVNNTDGLAEAVHRPGHALPRSRHRAHDGRLVPGRRLPHALPGEVAPLAPRPDHSGHPREPADQRRRRRRRPGCGRRLPPRRSSRPLRLLGLDRPRTARRRQGRHRVRRATGCSRTRSSTCSARSPRPTTTCRGSRSRRS